MGQTSTVFHCCHGTPGSATHTPSCLRKPAERQRPLRCCVNHSLCLLVAFHNPCALICPDPTMTFADSKFTPRTHPAQGISLSRTKGKALFLRGNPETQHPSIVPLMPSQPLACWLLVHPVPPGMGRGLACQMHLGHHPQSFIMMCLFTEDLECPF